MTDAQKTPVVEEIANHQAAVGSSLKLRIRQQEILAELGVLSLQGTPFPELLRETASLTAEGLEAEFCKILEYQRKEARFLVTAGVGWGPDVIGVATVGADISLRRVMRWSPGSPLYRTILKMKIGSGLPSFWPGMALSEP